MRRASIIFVVVVLAAAGLFDAYRSLQKPTPIAQALGGAATTFDSAGEAGARAAIKVGDKWEYIDKRGQYAIKPPFDRVGEFIDGLAGAEVGGKWGYIDKTGEYAINPQFDEARDF